MNAKYSNMQHVDLQVSPTFVYFFAGLFVVHPVSCYRLFFVRAADIFETATTLVYIA